MLFLAENLGVLLVALGVGTGLTRRPGPRIYPAPPEASALEFGLASSTVLINSLVTLIGWWLWRAGFIHLHGGSLAQSFGEALCLLLIMDGAMYVCHRLAHHPLAFRLVHGLHHRFEAPRPLTLFVMHPLEVVGFGGLWLVVLWAVAPTWGGMGLYLALNVAFGVVGHVGVEPLPLSPWMTRWLGTAAFHGIHHQKPTHKFGFYTQIWDRVFKTEQ